MNIYSLISNKNHNQHYLNRYLSFIDCCKTSQKNDQLLEKHHILPSSSDLFPEFKSFKKFPWNKIELTVRQHYIAHWLLWKSFGGKQTQAFFLMCNRTEKRSSKSYLKVRNFQMEMMKSNKNPMKNKKTVDKFRHKRPEQSLIAQKRNLEYWKINKRERILKYSICQECGELFGKIYNATNIQNPLTCSRSCNGKRNRTLSKDKITKSLKNGLLQIRCCCVKCHKEISASHINCHFEKHPTTSVVEQVGTISES